MGTDNTKDTPYHRRAGARSGPAAPATTSLPVGLHTLAGDGGTLEILQDGTRVQKTPDGTVLHMFPDGSKRQTDPNTGVTLELSADGRQRQTRPDGTVLHIFPDGSKRQTDPNTGVTLELSADGRRRTQHNADGTRTVSTADGPTLHYGTDGSVQEIDPATGAPVPCSIRAESAGSASSASLPPRPQKVVRLNLADLMAANRAKQAADAARTANAVAANAAATTSAYLEAYEQLRALRLELEENRLAAGQRLAEVELRSTQALQTMEQKWRAALALVADLKGECAELRADRAAAGRERTRSVAQTRDESAAVISALREEVDALKKSHQATMRRGDGGDTSQASHARTTMALEAAAAEDRARWKTEVAQREAAEAELASVQGTLASTQGRLKGTRNELRLVRGSLAKLQASVLEKDQAFGALVDKAGRAAEEAVSLKEQLDAALEEGADLTAASQELEARCERAELEAVSSARLAARAVAETERMRDESREAAARARARRRASSAVQPQTKTNGGGGDAAVVEDLREELAVQQAQSARDAARREGAFEAQTLSLRAHFERRLRDAGDTLAAARQEAATLQRDLDDLALRHEASQGTVLEQRGALAVAVQEAQQLREELGRSCTRHAEELRELTATTDGAEQGVDMGAVAATATDAVDEKPPRTSRSGSVMADKVKSTSARVDQLQEQLVAKDEIVAALRVEVAELSGREVAQATEIAALKKAVSKAQRAQALTMPAVSPVAMVSRGTSLSSRGPPPMPRPRPRARGPRARGAPPLPRLRPRGGARAPRVGSSGAGGGLGRGGRGGLLAAIQGGGVKLKKTEASNRKSKPAPSAGGGGMLAELMAKGQSGLRKVQRPQENSPKTTPSSSGGLMAQMMAAHSKIMKNPGMARRRHRRARSMAKASAGDISDLLQLKQEQRLKNSSALQALLASGK